MNSNRTTERPVKNTALTSDHMTKNFGRQGPSIFVFKALQKICEANHNLSIIHHTVEYNSPQCLWMSLALHLRKRTVNDFRKGGESVRAPFTCSMAASAATSYMTNYDV